MLKEQHPLILQDNFRCQLRLELLREFFQHLQTTPSPLEAYLAIVEQSSPGTRYGVSQLIEVFLTEVFATHQPDSASWRIADQSLNDPVQMLIELSGSQEEALDLPMWLSELYHQRKNDALSAEEFSSQMWASYIRVTHSQPVT